MNILLEEQAKNWQNYKENYLGEFCLWYLLVLSCSHVTKISFQ